MADVKDKIRRLLKLAESPNENEAQAALLKARQLMAEHKLSMQDVREKKGHKVITRKLDITFSNYSNNWRSPLSAVIAENYCCVAISTSQKYGKLRTVGFKGFKDDVAICEEVYRYANDYVTKQCEDMKERYKEVYTAKYLRKLQGVYGIGFTVGLEEAFQEQNRANAQWGLVMVTPEEVTDSVKELKKFNSTHAKADDSNLILFQQYGYEDGREFQVNKMLKGKRKERSDSFEER